MFLMQVRTAPMALIWHISLDHQVEIRKKHATAPSNVAGTADNVAAVYHFLKFGAEFTVVNTVDRELAYRLCTFVAGQENHVLFL